MTCFFMGFNYFDAPTGIACLRQYCHIDQWLFVTHWLLSVRLFLAVSDIIRTLEYGPVPCGLFTCHPLALLQELFDGFQHGGQSAIPPDVLRRAMAECYEEQNRFQIGRMDDAAECFVSVRMWSHMDGVTFVALFHAAHVYIVGIVYV